MGAPHTPTPGVTDLEALRQHELGVRAGQQVLDQIRRARPHLRLIRGERVDGVMIPRCGEPRSAVTVRPPAPPPLPEPTTPTLFDHDLELIDRPILPSKVDLALALLEQSILCPGLNTRDQQLDAIRVVARWRRPDIHNGDDADHAGIPIPEGAR